MVQTVCWVPVVAVFAARMATGPTLTPQTAAATFAATPTFALSRMLTSPSETLTSPFCRELFAAPAGATSPTARSAVANSAAHVFLIDSKSYLPFVSLGIRPSRCPLSLAWEGYPWLRIQNNSKGRAPVPREPHLPRTRDTEEGAQTHSRR